MVRREQELAYRNLIGKMKERNKADTGNHHMDPPLTDNLNVIKLCTLCMYIKIIYQEFCRQGPVEVEPVIAQALENQLRSTLDMPSDESGSEEDSDHLPNEWEAVS